MIISILRIIGIYLLHVQDIWPDSFFVDFVASALTLLVRHHELHLASNNIISAVSKVLGPFESTRKLYNSHRAVCV